MRIKKQKTSLTLDRRKQVWSNGKLKKVRGSTVVTTGSEAGKSGRSISMALLLTLPLDTPPVSPLLPPPAEAQPHQDEEEDKPLFRSFGFEDYAWRVCHERLLLKDPLDRYRI